MNHGIQQQHLNTIRDILQNTCAHIDRVDLFGSRATGKFRETSDIDLAIHGDISEEEGDRLYTRFFESMIPHKIDVTVYGHVSYPPFKRHIDAVAKTLFTNEQIYHTT